MIAAPVIGHRGAAHLAPENTLSGIQLAAECGVQWVELDVTLLGDGTPVLCHDSHLDRFSNHQSPLEQLSETDLMGLDVGAWFDPQWINEPMPRLSDALLLCQQLGLGLNLEIKPFDIETDIIVRTIHEEVSVYWQTKEQLIISSYDHELLTHYREYDLFAQLGLLFDDIPEFWKLKATALQASSIHCDCHLITEEEVKEIITSGYDLYCYTCNDIQMAERLFAWGVDGIFTDNPILMNQFLQPKSVTSITV